MTNTHPFPFHNEPSPMKTVGGVGFEVNGNMTFQKSGLYKHVL